MKKHKTCFEESRRIKNGFEDLDRSPGAKNCLEESPQKLQNLCIASNPH